MNKTAEDLLKAQNLLLTNGWCKGHYKNPQGNYCMIGAIGTTADKTSKRYKTQFKRQEAMERAVKVVLPDDSIVDFNDGKKTKKNDVLKIFDLAASVALSNEL